MISIQSMPCRVGVYALPALKPLTLIGILNQVCSYFNVSIKEVDRRTREREYVFPRQVYFYLADTFTSHSQRSIISVFSFTDNRTMVVDGRDTIKDLMFSDPEIKLQVEHLKIQCGL